MDQKTIRKTGEEENGFHSCDEHCWVILGHSDGDLWWGRLSKMTSGTPVTVGFDAEWVIKQEEEKQNIFGFLHTHPHMTNHYSSRDDETMKAWCICMGKPLVCCIHGINGLTAWWYADDESQPEEYQVKRIGKIIFGITPELYKES